MESPVFCLDSKRYSSQIILIKDIKSHFLVQTEVNLETEQNYCCGQYFSIVLSFTYET